MDLCRTGDSAVKSHPAACCTLGDPGAKKGEQGLPDSVWPTSFREASFIIVYHFGGHKFKTAVRAQFSVNRSELMNPPYYL